jgi:PAS domain-containing protein
MIPASRRYSKMLTDIVLLLAHAEGDHPMSSLAAARPQSSLARLRIERDRFVAFAFSWADLLFELDETSRIVYATGVLESLVGRTGRDLHGTAFCDLVLPQERAKAAGLAQALRADRGRRFVCDRAK